MSTRTSTRKAKRRLARKSKSDARSAGRRVPDHSSEHLGARLAVPSLVLEYLKIAGEDLARDGIVVTENTAEGLKAAERVVVGAAFHEAGHAVMLRHAVGDFPVLVSIERGSDQLQRPGWGFTRRSAGLLHQPESVVRTLMENSSPDVRRFLRCAVEREVMYSLAGEAVGAVHRQSIDADHDSLSVKLRNDCDENWNEDGDFDIARKMLLKFERDEKGLWRWMRELAYRTEQLVHHPRVWDPINALAEALLNKPTLEEGQLLDLLRSVPVLR